MTKIIIAGPKGEGKTNFARDFLPAEAQTLSFINADLIADGLALFNPESASIKAGCLMLDEIEKCEASGQSFAFGTTFFWQDLFAENCNLAEAQLPI